MAASCFCCSETLYVTIIDWYSFEISFFDT